MGGDPSVVAGDPPGDQSGEGRTWLAGAGAACPDLPFPPHDRGPALIVSFHRSPLGLMDSGFLPLHSTRHPALSPRSISRFRRRNKSHYPPDLMGMRPSPAGRSASLPWRIVSAAAKLPLPHLGDALTGHLTDAVILL